MGNSKVHVDVIHRPTGKFWQAEWEMLFSTVYLSLSAKSKDLLHYFWSLLKWERGLASDRKGKTRTGRRRCSLNNGELIATYETIMEKLRIGSRGTVSRSIQELLDKGFIDLVQPGCGKLRVVSKYAISNRWRSYDKEGFIPAPDNRRRSEAVLARSRRTDIGLFRPANADKPKAEKQKKK